VAKPFQHRRFAAAGLPVPESLATSDPAALETFVETVEDVVYKPVAGGGYATELTEADLSPDRLEKLSNSPVLFQERVDGENYRLYVLDGEVIANICIDSEQLDYRTGEHTIETRDVDERIADAGGIAGVGRVRRLSRHRYRYRRRTRRQRVRPQRLSIGAYHVVSYTHGDRDR